MLDRPGCRCRHEMKCRRRQSAVFHRSISTSSFHDNIHGAKPERGRAAAGLWRTVQQLQYSTQVTDPLASSVVHYCALVVHAVRVVQ